MDKANLETKFSYNEKVFIKKGFYKRHTGIVLDVENKDDIYIYQVELDKYVTKNDKPVREAGEKIKINESMIMRKPDNPIAKFLGNILGI